EKRGLARRREALGMRQAGKQRMDGTRPEITPADAPTARPWNHRFDLRGESHSAIRQHPSIWVKRIHYPIFGVKGIFLPKFGVQMPAQADISSFLPVARKGNSRCGNRLGCARTTPHAIRAALILATGWVRGWTWRPAARYRRPCSWW